MSSVNHGMVGFSDWSAIVNDLQALGCRGQAGLKAARVVRSGLHRVVHALLPNVPIHQLRHISFVIGRIGRLGQ